MTPINFNHRAKLGSDYEPDISVSFWNKMLCCKKKKKSKTDRANMTLIAMAHCSAGGYGCINDQSYCALCH